MSLSLRDVTPETSDNALIYTMEYLMTLDNCKIYKPHHLAQYVTNKFTVRTMFSIFPTTYNEARSGWVLAYSTWGMLLKSVEVGLE